MRLKYLFVLKFKFIVENIVTEKLLLTLEKWKVFMGENL